MKKDHLTTLLKAINDNVEKIEKELCNEFTEKLKEYEELNIDKRFLAPEDLTDWLLPNFDSFIPTTINEYVNTYIDKLKMK